MEDLKRVYVTQDEDSHWYVIPYELVDLFNDLTAPFGYPNDALTDEEVDELYEERGRREEAFDKEFSQYATGGDINNIELYARI